MLHFGFSYIGLIFLFMLFIPNILWTRHKPKDYEKYVGNENKILFLFERTGEILVCCIALVFSDFNLREGNLWSAWLGLAVVAMLFYECYWIRLLFLVSRDTGCRCEFAGCGIFLLGNLRCQLFSAFCNNYFGNRSYRDSFGTQKGSISFREKERAYSPDVTNSFDDSFGDNFCIDYSNHRSQKL